PSGCTQWKPWVAPAKGSPRTISNAVRSVAAALAGTWSRAWETSAVNRATSVVTVLANRYTSLVAAGKWRAPIRPLVSETTLAKVLAAGAGRFGGQSTVF